MFLLTDPNEEEAPEVIIIEPIKDTKPRCPLCGGDLLVPCLIEGQATYAITHRGIDLNRPYYFQTGHRTAFRGWLCVKSAATKCRSKSWLISYPPTSR